MTADQTGEAEATRQKAKLVIEDDNRQFSIFIVAGEQSGDALGAALMAALNRRLMGRVRYLGVGGEQMERHGLISQFPLSDVAVMGPLSILPRLPRLIRRVYRTVDACVAAEPDALVIIDSPEFTHAIAKRVRKRRPAIPIINYVSPSVWAWRQGRARKMAAYIDHVLALLPFEPEAHERLGGPPCTYVGHPLSERISALRATKGLDLARRRGIDPKRPVLVVLPGSRASEVSRLMGPFGAALALLQERDALPQIIIPAVPWVRELIDRHVAAWPGVVHIVEGEDDKFKAFALADAALAASGTVTLELAAAGTPMVVAYRVDPLAAKLRFLLKVPSVVLANLVLGENAFSEFIQEDCTPEKLADAVGELLKEDSPARQKQIEALAKFPERMRFVGESPSEAAADIVDRYMREGRSTANPAAQDALATLAG